MRLKIDIELRNVLVLCIENPGTRKDKYHRRHEYFHIDLSWMMVDFVIIICPEVPAPAPPCDTYEYTLSEVPANDVLYFTSEVAAGPCTTAPLSEYSEP